MQENIFGPFEKNSISNLGESRSLQSSSPFRIPPRQVSKLYAHSSLFEFCKWVLLNSLSALLSWANFLGLNIQPFFISWQSVSLNLHIQICSIYVRSLKENSLNSWQDQSLSFSLAMDKDLNNNGERKSRSQAVLS